jgi:hypothetical protein
MRRLDKSEAVARWGKVMLIRVFLAFGLILGIGLFLGCGHDSTSDLIAPEHLTLYSIDGREFEPGKEPSTEEKFHGYPVLGKLEVQDESNRQKIVAALKEGFARSDGKELKCFWPRHGIRVVEKGRTIDFVICFHCYEACIYEGSSRRFRAVTRDPQPLLNACLKEAGIPLTPENDGKDD